MSVTIPPAARTLSLLNGVLLAALALSAGCPATVPWRRGDLDTTLNATFAHSARAAQMTVVQLGYTPVTDRQEARHAALNVRHPSGHTLEIHLRQATDHTTWVKIRQDPVGEPALLHDVLTRIKSNL